MKKALQAFLQRIFGFQRYLYLFSRFKILTLRWDGPQQEGDFNHFLTLIRPQDVVLDIGANIGIMTVLMAQRAKQGQVYAFEPVPDNLAVLHKVVAAYRLTHVNILPFALGEDQAQVEMSMPILKGVKMQGLSHVNHQSIEGYQASANTYRVEQKSLDQIEVLRQTTVNAIKIDVENYEQFVFRGGKELLQRCKPIIYCELWDNENRRNCFDFLTNLGYLIRVLVDEKLVTFDPLIHPNHNFFFIPAT
ncbi:MAG: FkbM family methyltransferase [Bacteroidota bacterium]